MATVVETQSVVPATVVSQPPMPQNGGGFRNVSLYVGDLDRNVEEGQLYDLFNQVAQVVSVRVCRDQTTKVSLGYGYVNFGNPNDAANAREALNFVPLNGKPIRIMFSNRDPSARKTGFGNVFVKNLDTSIDNKGLFDTFSAFGTVLSCKVAVDTNSQSKGYGFVQFEMQEAAEDAIKKLNGMLLNDKQVYVGRFIRQQERPRLGGSLKFTNVYIKNLSDSFSDEDLKIMFGKYGSINSAVVMRDANGKSRCFGFVNFQNPDDAAVAVENLNGKSSSDDNILYVGRAQKKSEREAELKEKIEQKRISKFEKLKGANLYVKNLDNRIDDEKLKELFSKFGTITSCKVSLHPQGGGSKGFGFVAFSNPDDASKARAEMDGLMVGGKPLYVAVAQCKEARRAQLQAQFAQSAGFHLGAPRLPQHLYCGHGSPGMIPPHLAGYGFRQQHSPGLHRVVAPNFVRPPFPFQRQGQFGPQLGSRRGGNEMDRNPTNGFSRSAGPVDLTLLKSVLSYTDQDEHRTLLGEALFPLVEKIERDHASKVTGMLLEMEEKLVLYLLEFPEELKKKVAEAMDALRSAGKLGSDAK